LEDINAEPVFENMMIGNVITPSWMAAIEKGFKEQVAEGPLTDHPVSGYSSIRIVTHRYNIL